ncbi:GNAT family N-acetyltransferase [Pedobacter sp. SYP-B3415]|uniref:GNAT family N-acetyltransferase n=1 Tax=Pedobacter sp. SYP-B3415 TaxID=2496641 RepID=UPI00101C2E81|nr:GNAT family N-acetyltransferase [Pedobacter sp. SYP-B3415]
MDQTLLDNPAWAALNGPQALFAVGNGCAVRYSRELLPFAALAEPTHTCISALMELTEPGEHMYLIGDLPELPPDWQLLSSLPCTQMLLGSMPANVHSEVPELLGPEDAAEMFELVNLVQPGYFAAGTGLLGCYYGIRHSGKLIALAGERMRLPGYVELSAIVTRPGFTGRGYARTLISKLCGVHSRQRLQSCLHVAHSNQRAIGIYESMGFVRRREITFHKLQWAN